MDRNAFRGLVAVNRPMKNTRKIDDDDDDDDDDERVE